MKKRPIMFWPCIVAGLAWIVLAVTPPFPIYYLAYAVVTFRCAWALRRAE